MVSVLPEETVRKKGREAQQENIRIARLLARTIRTTLGPKGMDKMLVDEDGDITVTNDGVTILNEMQLDHPCAKLILEVARTQEAEVGDGTTTAVILAGGLLDKAEKLIEEGMHPTTIIRGYVRAAEEAKGILEEISLPVVREDGQLLKTLAHTAMTGKGVEGSKELLASLVARAVELAGNFDRRSAMIRTISGESIGKSSIVEGFILDARRVHSGMPLKVENPRIALMDAPLEVRMMEMDARISITSPEQLQQFLDAEERIIREQVEKLASSGATVVCNQKGIDDLAANLLAKKGILALRRVPLSDLVRLEHATGAKLVQHLSELSNETLGAAGLVEERHIAGHPLLFFEQCEGVTILLRGSTEHILAEARRTVEDAIGDIAAALDGGRAIPGAAAAEIEIAGRLENSDDPARAAFAQALLVIPWTLAESGGFEPQDILARLRDLHSEGKIAMGIDVYTGEAIDAWQNGIVEPLQVKLQALDSAIEVASMILRIDDLIAAKPRRQREEEAFFSRQHPVH